MLILAEAALSVKLQYKRANPAQVTGGRNGYGAKLCNIFSTEFVVETGDKSGGMKYKQVRAFVATKTLKRIRTTLIPCEAVAVA